MDYLDIYNKNYSSAFSKAEEMIKQKLIACKEEKRDATFALNQSRGFLESYNQNSIIAKNRSLTNLESVFQQSLGYYSEDRILRTLKNEITQFYNKLTSDDLPENYSFLIMIADLADYRGTKEVLRLFQNQFTLYQMMYELNDFNQFKIEDYGNINYQDTPLFKELKNRRYPNQKSVTKNKTHNESSSLLLVSTYPDMSPYPYEIQNESNNENLLTEEETAILIYFYNKIQREKIYISKSQLYKCLSLINVRSMDSYSNYKSFKNSAVYKILNNNFKRAKLNNLTKKDKSNILDLISVSTELLSKIKKHKIKKIETEINAFINEIRLIIS